MATAQRTRKPRLTIAEILRWVDAHFARTRKWPTVNSGKVREAPSGNWRAIDLALRLGFRGLPGGSSLAKLLAEKCGIPNRMSRPRLTYTQILAWADDHKRRTGRWPNQNSGPVLAAPGETWRGIHRALKRGDRGLPGGETLAGLLQRRRNVRSSRILPPLREPLILKWADNHYRRFREWPSPRSGRVVGAPHEEWPRINTALSCGLRGLPGGSSLAKLLAEHRGVRSKAHLPRLTYKQILAWADHHFAHTGEWPTRLSGRVLAAAHESWMGIDDALRRKLRGIRRRTSLARLLAERRGYRYFRNRPRLRERQILLWADAHLKRTGEWPDRYSGIVLDCPTESWPRITNALERGHRGLPGGSSLAQLLAEHRGVRNPKALPPLSYPQILAWADHHKDQTGDWPDPKSGPVLAAPDEVWRNINNCMVRGHRGLPGGMSLRQLLAEHRGIRNKGRLSTLTEMQVVKWGRRHLRQAGNWPNRNSGEVIGAPGEKWPNLDQALRVGLRGLPGGSSLSKLRSQYGDGSGEGPRFAS
jgi:pyrroloquinoline quinone (PQQ) biosynthesis protein C